MISTAITLFIFTILYLIIGLFKPQWALYGMKNPNRITVIVISVLMIMVSMTLFGEGVKRKKETSQATEAKELPAAEIKEKTEPKAVN